MYVAKSFFFFKRESRMIIKLKFFLIDILKLVFYLTNIFISFN